MKEREGEIRELMSDSQLGISVSVDLAVLLGQILIDLILLELWRGVRPGQGGRGRGKERRVRLRRVHVLAGGTSR